MRDLRLASRNHKAQKSEIVNAEDRAKESVMETPLAQSLKKHFEKWHPTIVKSDIDNKEGVA